jgi:hypothetical protein
LEDHVTPSPWCSLRAQSWRISRENDSNLAVSDICAEIDAMRAGATPML